MKILYANILFLILVLINLFFGIWQRHSSGAWSGMEEVSLKYNFLYGSLAIFLLVCVVGLLRKRPWAYLSALTANITIAILPLSIFIASLYLLLPDIEFGEIVRMQIYNLGLSLFGFAFWILIPRSKKYLV